MMINDRLKLRFVSFTLMLSLAAALAMRAAAEEAAPQPSSDAKAANSGTHSPDSSSTGKNSPPPSGEANTDDIDTRITVQPHGPPPGKPGKVGGATNPIVPLKLVNPHRRTFSPSRAANRFVPNASGFPGPQHQNVQQNLGQRFEYQGLGQRGTGGGGGGGVGLAKPGSPFGRQQVFQPSGISPIAGGSKTLIRGGIGGANLNRRVVGSGTSGIGGPTRTVTGINGSSIRETH
jgi:hypothetical protein